MIFKCTECGEEFYTPEYYEETHGLDCGPYERVGVCPKCESTDYKEWDDKVEKIEVADLLLKILAALNCLKNSISDVFGDFKNEELEYAREICAEYVEEMYDEFIPRRISEMMREIVNSSDAEQITRILER